MKVYLVREGWISPDCSPGTMGIYRDYDNARQAIKTLIKQDQDRHLETNPNGSWRLEEDPCDGDVECWTAYIRFEPDSYVLDEQEYADTSWLLEPWEVQ